MASYRAGYMGCAHRMEKRNPKGKRIAQEGL
jgi:hypothetical protein